MAKVVMLQHQGPLLQTERPRLMLPNRHPWRVEQEEWTHLCSCCFLVRDLSTLHSIEREVRFLNLRCLCTNNLSAVHTWRYDLLGSMATVDLVVVLCHSPVQYQQWNVEHVMETIFRYEVNWAQPGWSFPRWEKDRFIWGISLHDPVRVKVLVLNNIVWPSSKATSRRRWSSVYNMRAWQLAKQLWLQQASRRTFLRNSWRKSTGYGLSPDWMVLNFADSIAIHAKHWWPQEAPIR